MDLFIPPWVRVSGSGYKFISNVAAASSIFTGATRTVDRTGDRVGISISTSGASHRETDPNRAFLETLTAHLRGQSNRLIYCDSSYTPRGSFPATELLTNPTFGDGTTSWSASSANIVLSATDRILRSTRASVSGDETIRAAVATTVSGASYALRVMAFAGLGSMDYRLRLGTSAGGSELASSSSDITSGGMTTLVGTATGTSTHVSIVDGNTGRSIGNFMDFMYVSLSRCALIAGASQTGRTLNIDALPVSTTGLARYGDWVQIGNQLNKVTSSLDSNSSGAGLLQLAYPLRSTPADNSSVIFHQPMGRFISMSNEGGYEVSPGTFTNHQFDFVEALDS